MNAKHSGKEHQHSRRWILSWGGVITTWQLSFHLRCLLFPQKSLARTAFPKEPNPVPADRALLDVGCTPPLRRCCAVTSTTRLGARAATAALVVQDTCTPSPSSQTRMAGSPPASVQRSPGRESQSSCTPGMLDLARKPWNRNPQNRNHYTDSFVCKISPSQRRRRRKFQEPKSM